MDSLTAIEKNYLAGVYRLSTKKYAAKRATWVIEKGSNVVTASKKINQLFGLHADGRWLEACLILVDAWQVTRRSVGLFDMAWYPSDVRTTVCRMPSHRPCL